MLKNTETPNTYNFNLAADGLQPAARDDESISFKNTKAEKTDATDVGLVNLIDTIILKMKNDGKTKKLKSVTT